MQINGNEKKKKKNSYICFRVARGRSDWVDNILTELIFETVDNSDPSESTSSPGVSDGSKNQFFLLVFSWHLSLTSFPLIFPIFIFE